MHYVYIITGLAIVVSLFINSRKTLIAFKIAGRTFVTILPAFLVMLVFVSIVLYLVPEEFISSYLGGDNKYLSVLFASFIGSIILMPGFIAFPLCGILLEKGVVYMLLSAFTTTLMMVGVLTYPVESAYLGRKVTIMRNAISFLIALIVALVIGIFFGEVFK